jgi:hypothetical protein
MILMKNWITGLSKINGKETFVVKGEYYDIDKNIRIGEGIIVISTAKYDRAKDLVYVGNTPIKLGEPNEDYEKRFPNARRSLLKIKE